MKPTKNLIIGAGPTATHTARLLAEAGEQAILVSRRGGGAPDPRVSAVAADARDAHALETLAAGAAFIFNCAMPAYDRWPLEFPPLAASVLAAARSSGARLVTLSNVYVYGKVAGPFREASPIAPTTIKGRVRARIWHDALASGAPVTEVRASDFLGRNAASLFTLLTLPPVLRGEPAPVVGDLDAAHSFTFTRDVAATMVAASRHADSWSRAWHVPSTTASVRVLCEQLARLAHLPAPALKRLTDTELQAIAWTDPLMREVAEMTYLYDWPCLLDSAETERILGVAATPLDAVLRDTLEQ